jgi:hypothetical protein
MKKICLVEDLNKIRRIGNGANHKRYQKSPFNPFEMYHNTPERIIAAIVVILLEKIFFIF